MNDELEKLRPEVHPMADTMTLEQVRDELRAFCYSEHVVATRSTAKEWVKTIDAAIKQHEQNRLDAARFRWLRKQHNSNIPSWHVRSSTNSIPLDLDIGLDAAMAKESGNG